MSVIKLTSQFKKDLKKVRKQSTKSSGIDILDSIILPKLLIDEPLEIKYHDHELTGFNPSKRDCHVLPDLVLLYRLTDEYLILYRLGSHSELFQ
ncbi:MAG: type II toxin-antitoxin system mRNA interferase toxin, RelE/StbE family [Gammaproteobacteria bacterium]|nr:MAG: type II toxin-antitoxin system mRNA interferase toxin, RelE/StbE family [Gammaproteobacteria bacterium]